METINVPEITVPRLGRIHMQKCGNEGNHPYLDETKKVTLKFLRAAIDFIPLALDVAGDLENASFFFAVLLFSACRWNHTWSLRAQANTSLYLGRIQEGYQPICCNSCSFSLNSLMIPLIKEEDIM